MAPVQVTMISRNRLQSSNQYENEESYRYASKLTNFIHIAQRQKCELFRSGDAIGLQLWDYVLQAEARQPGVDVTHFRLLLLTLRCQQLSMKIPKLNYDEASQASKHRYL